MRGRGAVIAGWAGLAGHVVVGVVPYAGTGLVAPPAGVAVLWMIWVGLLVAGLVLLRRRPALVTVVPVTAVVVWLVVVSVGDAALGWTASGAPGWTASGAPGSTASGALISARPGP